MANTAAHHSARVPADTPVDASQALLVVCLCADWCLTCKAFQRDFEQFAAATPGVLVRWLDIEDEAELMGDIDVETFPTVLVAMRDRVSFFGPILPNREHLAQLVARAGALNTADGEIKELAARLRGHFGL